MPPKFMAESFLFEPWEMPEHIEDRPFCSERDRSKIWLEGEDTFSQEFYTLAIDVDDMVMAHLLCMARYRRLDLTQPLETSGGQGGIQDCVHIRRPVTHGVSPEVSEE